MGFINKIKGILFDEEEIEIPEIKSEPKVDEVKKEGKEDDSIKEIKVPKDDFSDKTNYKSETTFTFPVDFNDDEDIEDTIPIRTHVEEKKVIEKKKDVRDYTDFLNKKEEKKRFKPTPIISPVYGVLDQNYKKEDVIVKKDVLRKPSELTLEEVRKRAFGSLEDDLEQNLLGNTKEIIVEKEVKNQNVVVEAPIDKLKTIGELIEEDSVKPDIEEIGSIIVDEDENNNNTIDIAEEPKNSIEDLLNNNNKEDNIIDEEIDDEEADLFSLIDSMYEEKGE